MFSELKNNNLELRNIYARLMKIVLFIIAPILLIISALSNPFFAFVFSEKWIPAAEYFKILCWSGILYPIHSYNLNILKVKGRSDLFLRLEIFKKVILVIILIISFQWGIKGIVIGSVITSVIAFFVNSYYSGILIGYNFLDQIKDFLPIISLAWFISLIVNQIDNYLFQLNFSDFIRLLLGFTGGIMIYLFLAKLLHFESVNEIKKLWRNFKK